MYDNRYEQLPLWGQAVRKIDNKTVNWFQSVHGLMPALVGDHGDLTPLDRSVQHNENDFYALVKPEPTAKDAQE